MADTDNLSGKPADSAPEGIEHTAPIRVLIANAGEMAGMFSDIDRLKDRSFMRAWHDFPITKEEIGAILREIGAGAAHGSDYIITNYETDIAGLRDRLPIGADINELNYLAVKLAGMDEFQLEKFCAALEYSVFRDGLTDIINTAENLDCFDLQPAFSVAEYGEFLADMEFDSFGVQVNMLEESKNPAYRELAEYIGFLEKHFNKKAYGREKVQEEGGRFTKQGYLTKKRHLNKSIPVRRIFPWNTVYLSFQSSIRRKDRPRWINWLPRSKPSPKLTRRSPRLISRRRNLPTRSFKGVVCIWQKMYSMKILAKKSAARRKTSGKSAVFSPAIWKK